MVNNPPERHITCTCNNQIGREINSDFYNYNIYMITKLIDSLSEEKRIEILSQYCHYCGRKNPSCSCENDE